MVESEVNGSGASETGDPESKEIQSSECCDPQMTRIETGLNAAFSTEKTRETQRDFNGIMFVSEQSCLLSHFLDVVVFCMPSLSNVCRESGSVRLVCQRFQ